MPPTDGNNHDVSQESRSLPRRSDGSSSRRPVPTRDGRASGELEGSTLGSSSREGDRRTPGQRRTQSSSGFLLDTLPRSRSLRLGSHRSRPSEPAIGAPDGEIVVPKRRSRFPWSRHKASASETTQVTSESSATAAERAPTPPPDGPQIKAPSRANSGTHGERRVVAPGMDRDSLQIVNLALNLNESRRRNASGLAPGPNGRKALSVSRPTAAPLELLPPSSAGKNVQRDSSYRDYTQILGEGTLEGPPVGAKSPVVDFLPSTAANDNRLYDFSERTLARADRARRHFELFNEYLRLLPSLPPLRKPRVTNDSDSSDFPPAVAPTSRTYNPLQTIRNRKIRYREKCPINPEADGWHDVDKVHDWVNSIQKHYSDTAHDETQIIKLPSFQQGHHHVSYGDTEDVEMAVSPPASLRRVSRTNSIKTTRPRLDWTTSPAELLADVAWLEDSSHRAKIVDRDGNKIYPDPTELVVLDSSAEHTYQIPRLSVEMVDPSQEELPSCNPSSPSVRPALEPEFKSVGRGRHKHIFQSHFHSTRSRSASSSGKRSPWDRVRMRTGSVSSEPSPERRKSSDRSHRAWEHSRNEPEALSRKESSNVLKPGEPRSKSPPTAAARDTNRSETSDLPPLSTKGSHVGRQASFSSTSSMDDKFHPRMSLEAMDYTAPNSPAHVGYFPSIAVKLSPPSSRSPSPAKKGLRHKIVSRHERSKSKQGLRDHPEPEDENLDAVVSHPALPSREQSERPSKLQPSPLPDTVSSSYFDDQGITESRFDGYRGRKGQHLPDSKLRGIFKGPGRIAEIVGNEVSKVGDMILKKDATLDSRKSSSATTVASDDSDSDEDEKRTDKRSGAKGLLRRLPNLTDEPGRLIRRETEKIIPTRGYKPSLPTFTSPLRQDDKSGGSSDAIELGSPRERASRQPDEHEGPKRMPMSRSKTLDFGPALQSARDRIKSSHAIKDPSNPFSLTKPPVTGLARARASPGPPSKRTPGISGAGRAWSISQRSIHSLNDSGVPGKTEIERTRTLLLSSGIKAREITRRAYSSRDPPHWLVNSMGGSSSVPRVTRISEFDTAAQNFLRRFEMTQYSFQQSMHHFTTATSSPLRSQLKDLETLINQTLTPRVRATADSAEDLCVQLNTTSTLAVKSLSDALDKGIRKRRRRLRWVRRAGFVVLEWALVGMLWWVWLIVMAFKLVRGVFRGALSGARWILWL